MIHETGEDDGELVVDLHEAVEEAKKVRIDGRELHDEVLARVFACMSDEELVDLHADLWHLVDDADAFWSSMRPELQEKMWAEPAWRRLSGLLWQVRLLLQSVWAAPAEELARRVETRVPEAAS